MNCKGWVCMWRKLNDNPIAKKPLICHLFLFVVRTVNHEDMKIIWNKEEMIVERGSMIAGRRSIAEKTGLTEQNVRSGLLTLYKLGMLEKSTSKSTSKFSYITVCNFDDYQDQKNRTNQITNQQLTSKQPAN